MGWRIYVEAVLAADCFVAGVWFWALQKSPAQLQSLLEDGEELRRFLMGMGVPHFRGEEGAIPKGAGSYADGLHALQRGRRIRMRRLGWVAAVFFLGLLLAGGFVSHSSFLLNVPLFLLPSLFPAGAYTERDNLSFVYSAAATIGQWMQSDPVRCQQHCTRVDIRFRRLHSVVQELSEQEGGPLESVPRREIVRPQMTGAAGAL